MREFTVAGEYPYKRSTPARWITSHLLRYKRFLFGYILLAVLTNILYSTVPTLTGTAFNAVTGGQAGLLVQIALTMLVLLLVQGSADLGARFSAEIIGKRFARDAREELYISLLGKSQTFHNRQRVGDVMARASNDISQLSDMVTPGFDLIFDSFTSLVVIL